MIRIVHAARIRHVTEISCGQLDDLAPAVALGSLDPEEAAFVSRHLRECGLSHRAVREALSLAAAIGASVPEEDRPGPGLRGRVLGAIREEPAANGPNAARSTLVTPAGSRWRAIALGAGALAVAASLALAVQLGESGALRTQVAATDARLTALETELDRAETWIERAVARGADAYFMDGEGDATAASFMLVVEDDASGGVLLMSGLPVLTEAETYELWVEQDGAVIGVGTFRADEGGLAAVTIDASLRGIRQAMITVEPAGGSSEPSADEVIMQGDLSL